MVSVLRNASGSSLSALRYVTRGGGQNRKFLRYVCFEWPPIKVLVIETIGQQILDCYNILSIVGIQCHIYSFPFDDSITLKRY